MVNHQKKRTKKESVSEGRETEPGADEKTSDANSV